MPPISSVQAPPAIQDPRQLAAIDQAARDFEAMFVTEMIRPMMDTIEVNDTFGGGKGEEVFRGMLVDEYGKLVARTNGIGLASHVKAALIAAQSGQNLPRIEKGN